MTRTSGKMNIVTNYYDAYLVNTVCICHHLYYSTMVAKLVQGSTRAQSHKHHQS